MQVADAFLETSVSIPLSLGEHICHHICQHTSTWCAGSCSGRCGDRFPLDVFGDIHVVGTLLASCALVTFQVYGFDIALVGC